MEMITWRKKDMIPTIRELTARREKWTKITLQYVMGVRNRLSLGEPMRSRPLNPPLAARVERGNQLQDLCTGPFFIFSAKSSTYSFHPFHFPSLHKLRMSGFWRRKRSIWGQTSQKVYALLRLEKQFKNKLQN